MQISAEMVKDLREKSGAGVMECKKALESCEGNLEKASSLLKEKGLAIAEKKATRTALKGIIEPYIHGGGRVGALVELNCETDFVARLPEFQELAHNIAMQVTAMNPKYLSVEAVPQGVEVKPEVDCLLSQPFIKDPTKNIQAVVTETIAKTGENIKVGRFVRYELGA
jgi:elongation factor Ts